MVSPLRCSSQTTALHSQRLPDMSDAQLACILIFLPITIGCLLAAVVEARNIYLRETKG